MTETSGLCSVNVLKIENMTWAHSIAKVTFQWNRVGANDHPQDTMFKENKGEKKTFAD